MAVNDRRQYVRVVAVNEEFVQYLFVVDTPQTAGYIPFNRYDECLVAAFAAGACPVFVRMETGSGYRISKSSSVRPSSEARRLSPEWTGPTPAGVPV